MSPQIPPPTSSVSVPSEDQGPGPPEPGPSWWPRLRRIIGSVLIVGWTLRAGRVEPARVRPPRSSSGRRSSPWSTPPRCVRDGACSRRIRPGPPMSPTPASSSWTATRSGSTRRTRPLGRLDPSERWRKWETRVFKDTHTSLRLPAARWVADRFGGPDEVAEVELVHLRSPVAGSADRRSADLGGRRVLPLRRRRRPGTERRRGSGGGVPAREAVDPLLVPADRRRRLRAAPHGPGCRGPGLGCHLAARSSRLPGSGRAGAGSPDSATGSSPSSVGPMARGWR